MTDHTKPEIPGAPGWTYDATRCAYVHTSGIIVPKEATAELDRGNADDLGHAISELCWSLVIEAEGACTNTDEVAKALTWNPIDHAGEPPPPMISAVDLAKMISEAQGQVLYCSSPVAPTASWYNLDTRHEPDPTPEELEAVAPLRTNTDEPVPSIRIDAIKYGTRAEMLDDLVRRLNKIADENEFGLEGKLFAKLYGVDVYVSSEPAEAQERFNDANNGGACFLTDVKPTMGTISAIAHDHARIYVTREQAEAIIAEYHEGFGDPVPSLQFCIDTMERERVFDDYFAGKPDHRIAATQTTDPCPQCNGKGTTPALFMPGAPDYTCTRCNGGGTV